MKGDDKFYMLSINPSQDEAAHLIRKVTGKQVTEFEQLTVEEQEKSHSWVEELLPELYGPVCGEFSQGEDKIRKGSCLFWEGGNGTPLQEQWWGSEGGTGKVGDRKPGLQLHVHIIVSRNDVTQTVRLSPLARSKGSFNELETVRKSWWASNRMEWKARCTDRFISMYGYKATHKYYRTAGNTPTIMFREKNEDEHGQIRHPAERIQKREEDAGCVLPDVPFHGESETGSHSGS